MQGFCAFLLITAWTFWVQKGYTVAKGRKYAETLTDELAKNIQEPPAFTRWLEV